MNNLPETAEEALIKFEWTNKGKLYTTYYLARYHHNQWVDEEGEVIVGKVVEWEYVDKVKLNKV